MSTILTEREQAKVDAAGIGRYTTRHRETVDEVVQDLKLRTARTVLLSVQRFERQEPSSISRLVREVPHVATIALLSGETYLTPATLLEMGRNGVRRLVDLRVKGGWNELQNLLAMEPRDVVRDRILECLTGGTDAIRPGCLSFFETLIQMSRTMTSVRQLARRLKILPSTLMSRFFRAGVPAPKRYLTMIRLTRAAYLLENSGFSIANVANYLEYSSPQSFGRHIRTMMGTTALHFREQYDLAGMVTVLERELIVPYRVQLRDFDPLCPIC